VLQESERLETYALVANACTKSQPHLLAISKRRSIEEAVTDVLVTRGNREVVNSVASNHGARFSEFGFLHMIQRAEGDSILAEQLGLRKDIPRHLFQQLIAKASEEVKKRLERERPAMVDQIQSSVTEVTGTLQSKFGPVSRSYFVAKRVVATQHQQGNLNEKSISGYARFHKFDEVTIGLSLLCALPGDVIERALIDRNRDMLLVLAKALDFSWETTMSLLFLGAKDHRITGQDLDDMEREYGRLNVETSRSVLQFYQSRKSAAAPDPAPRRAAAGAPRPHIRICSPSHSARCIYGRERSLVSPDAPKVITIGAVLAAAPAAVHSGHTILLPQKGARHDQGSLEQSHHGDRGRSCRRDGGRLGTAGTAMVDRHRRCRDTSSCARYRGR